MGMMEAATALWNGLTGKGSSYISSKHISSGEVEQLLKNNGLLRIAIEAVSEDVARAWRQFPEGSDAWTLAEERFKVRDITERALTLAEAFGGAFILPIYSIDGVQAQQLRSPRSQQREGNLLGFKAYPQSAFRLPSTRAVNMPAFADLPEQLELRKLNSGNDLLIHTSWLIPVHGPSKLESENKRHFNCDDLLGQSRIDLIFSAYNDLMRAVRNLSWLLERANIDVLSLAGLSEALATCKDNDEIKAAIAKVVDASASAIQGASIEQPMLIDADSKMERHGLQVTGAADITRLLIEMFVAVTRIPETRLMGKQPSGLSNNDTPGLTAYYDRVDSIRERKVTPLLNSIDALIAENDRALSLDSMWEYRPLTEMTEKERAEIAKSRAEQDKIYFDARVPFIISKIVGRLAEHHQYEFSDDELEAIRAADGSFSDLEELMNSLPKNG